MDRESAQEAAQAIIDLGNAVDAEYGYQSECEDALPAVRELYESHGPFELDWGYTYTPREWYDE